MRKHLVLFLTIGIFFIIATATSEEVVELDYDCQVQYENNSIILISEVDVDIMDAGLVLTVDLQSVNVSNYTLQNYSLGGLAIDTIAVGDFLNASDNSPFPIGETPDGFSLSFYSQDTIYNASHLF